MAEKPKAQGDQVRAFRKAARALGTDESEANFNAALKKVARQKPLKADQKSKPTRR